jgi:hypothetical protein
MCTFVSLPLDDITDDVKFSRSGWHGYPLYYDNWFVIIGMQINPTTPFSFEQICIVYLMITNGVYGFVIYCELLHSILKIF